MAALNWDNWIQAGSNIDVVRVEFEDATLEYPMTLGMLEIMHSAGDTKIDPDADVSDLDFMFKERDTICRIVHERHKREAPDDKYAKMDFDDFKFLAVRSGYKKLEEPSEDDPLMDPTRPGGDSESS